MAYEVWIFEQQPEGPSRLVSVAHPPPSYSAADVRYWAKQQEKEYANVGLDVSTVVRNEAGY